MRVLNIRELIEEIEKTRDNLMGQVSRLDYVLTSLYQQESEEFEKEFNNESE
jgi:hypothetical protein